VYTKRVRENPAADQLWLLRLDDRSEELLFEGQSAVRDPLWTPDGSGVVFLSDRRAPGAALDLWLLRISGGKPLGFPEVVKTGLGGMDKGRPATWALGPITRDGTYYFHQRQSGQVRQLMKTKFDPDTGKVAGMSSFVSRKGGESWSPSFSRDGRWLAYLLQNGESSPSVVIQSVETGEEKVVPMEPNPVRLNWAVIFPDGRSLLLQAVHPKGDYEIYRLDAASGAWTSLTKAREGEGELFPWAISPDDRTIYLSRWRAADGSRGWHLTALDSETGRDRELHVGEWNGVALSPDGKQLAMAHADGKDVVIDVMAAEVGSRREVYRASGFQRIANITWTTDGRYLVFAPSPDTGANTKAYLRVPLDGGEAQPIGISASQDERVQFPSSFGALRIHPGGHQLVYTGRGIVAQSEVWALENFIPGLKPSK
jgi:Tol biopolymer transport system component